MLLRPAFEASFGFIISFETARNQIRVEVTVSRKLAMYYLKQSLSHENFYVASTLRDKSYD